MSGSFEPVRWNACVHRLDLGLYSHPKEFFGGMESEPMLTPVEGKYPLNQRDSEASQTHEAASCRTVSPAHYQLSSSSSNHSLENRDFFLILGENSIRSKMKDLSCFCSVLNISLPLGCLCIEIIYCHW